MEPKLTITKLPHLNLVVIKQSKGARFFVAAPDSFIIDSYGLLLLVKQLIKLGFLDAEDLLRLVSEKD